MRIKPINFCLLFLLISLAFSATGCATLAQPELSAEDSVKLREYLSEGWKHLWANDFDQAINSFSEAHATDPNDASACRGLGLAYYASAREFDGFEYLHRSVTSNPTDPLSVPVRDFAVAQFPHTEVTQKELLSMSEVLAKQNPTRPWATREGLLSQMDHFLQVDPDGRSLDEFLQKLGFLDDGWQIVGPFPNISHSGFDKQFIDEGRLPIRSTGDTYVGIDNTEVKWFSPTVFAKNGRVDLSAYLERPTFSTAYALRDFQVPSPGIYTIVMSYSGAAKLWVDDNLIFSDPEYRRGNEMRYFSLNLAQGTRSFLLKLSNKSDSSDFSLSVIDQAFPAVTAHQNGFYHTVFDNDQAIGQTTLPDPLLSEIAERIDDDEDNIEAYFWLSVIAKNKGFVDEAVKILELAQNRLPEESALLLHSVGVSFEKSGDWNKSRNAHMRANALVPQFSPSALPLLYEALFRGQLDKAKMINDEVLRSHDQWYYGLYFGAVLSYANNDQEAGWNMLVEIAETYPLAKDPPLSLDDLSSMNMEYISDAQLSLLGKGGQRSAQTRYFIDRYLSVGDYISAARNADTLLNSNPVDPYLWSISLRGGMYESVQGYRDSLASAGQLLESFPRSVDLVALLLDHYRRTYARLRRLGKDGVLFNGRKQDVTKDPLFVKELRETEQRYKELLAHHIMLNPKDYETRAEWFQTEYGDALLARNETWQANHLISDFEQQSGDRVWNADAIVVANDVEELFFGDGAARKSGRSILKVLSRSGIRQLSSQDIYVHPYSDYLVVNNAYVTTSEGYVTEADVIDSTLSFPNLQIGDYVVVEYTIDSYNTGKLNRHFWTTFRLMNDFPVYRSHFRLTYPKDSHMTVRQHNFDHVEITQTTEDINKDYKTLSIRIENGDPIKLGAHSPGLADVGAWIDFSTLESWTEVSDWYYDLYRGQCIVTAEIGRVAASVTDGVHSDEDKIVALYDYVGRTIEYEDLLFQYSAYVPQEAESVLDDGYGDCKDKAVLLVSLLRSCGIDSYVALTTPDYLGENFFLPSTRFNHIVVAIPREDRVLYLDPTGGFDTYGEFPEELSGSYFLPVQASSETTVGLGRFPMSSREPETVIESEITIENGAAKITGAIEYHGALATYIRSLTDTNNPDVKKALFQSHCSFYIPGFELMDFTSDNIETLAAQPEVTFSGRFRIPYVRQIPGFDTLNLPWLVRLSPSFYAIEEQLEEQEIVEINDYSLASSAFQTIVFKIPPGLTIESVPESTVLSYGDAIAEFRFDADKNYLRVARRLHIPRMQVKKAEYSEFREFILGIIEKEMELVFIKSNE